MSYATDGKCHNAEPGTFNHECGKPAEFVGTSASGFRSGFCGKCKRSGYEARDIKNWTPFVRPLTGEARIAVELEELEELSVAGLRAAFVSLSTVEG